MFIITTVLLTGALLHPHALAHPTDKKLLRRASPWDSFDSAFRSLQSTYYSGNGWPKAIDWTEAVTGQLTSASLETYAMAASNPTAADADSTKGFVRDMWGNVNGYFQSEDAVNEFNTGKNDDLQWVVLSWLEGVRFNNLYTPMDPAFTGASQTAPWGLRAYQFYSKVAPQWDTAHCGGGLTWDPSRPLYKNSITNQLYIASSVGMYLHFPGITAPQPSNPGNLSVLDLPPKPAHDQALLDSAKTAYDWYMSHGFADKDGLLIDGFHSTGTACDQPDNEIFSYNQGVILDGMRGLWDATGDQKYLDDGHQHIQNVVKATGFGDSDSQTPALGMDGIMQDTCDADGSCSQDAQAFKSVFWLNLAKFCAPLATAQALVPGVSKTASGATATDHKAKCDSYMPWVQKNADAAAMTQRNGLYGMDWAGAAQLAQARDMAQARFARDNMVMLNEQGAAVVKATANGSGLSSLSSLPNPNDSGRGRTVETQDGGVAVMRAAYQMSL